jgi:hypothetical protein
VYVQKNLQFKWHFRMAFRGISFEKSSGNDSSFLKFHTGIKPTGI